MEDEELDDIEEPVRMPLGARLTAFFLDSLVFILSLPVLGAALFCLYTAGEAAHASAEAMVAIVTSFFRLGGFLAIFGTLLGANWLSMLIRARHAADEGRARWPWHPMRAIIRPMLNAVQIHAAASLLAWAVIKVGQFEETSWVWLGVWVSVVACCEAGIWWIDRQCQPE